MKIIDGDKLLDMIDDKMQYLQINFIITLMKLIKLSTMEYHSFENFSWIEGREILTKDENDYRSLAVCVIQDDTDWDYDNNMCLCFKESGESLSMDDPILRDYVWIKIP